MGVHARNCVRAPARGGSVAEDGRRCSFLSVDYGMTVQERSFG
jgi:hypothetical protein